MSRWGGPFGGAIEKIIALEARVKELEALLDRVVAWVPQGQDPDREEWAQFDAIVWDYELSKARLLEGRRTPKLVMIDELTEFTPEQWEAIEKRAKKP